MAYIFLSYAKADRASALTIRDSLQKAGLVVWMDENSSELSAKHWPGIQENISNAGAFVLLVSDAAKKSAWLKRELEYAEEIQKPIFPILIQGEGWSRLKMEMTRLGFGLNLDLPEDFISALKQTSQNVAKKPLPLQIFTHPIDRKAQKQKNSFFIWLGVMAVMVVSFWLLSPIFLDWINSRLNDSSLPEMNRQALTRESERQRLLHVTETSEAAEYRVNQTERAYEQSLTEAVGGRMTATQRAIDNQVRGTQLAREAVILETAQYEFNLTATLYNGQLPCTATIVDTGGMVLAFRMSPHLDTAITRGARSGQALTIIELVVNEDGLWYRATLNGSVMGYTTSEFLVLEEACPRDGD